MDGIDSLEVLAWMHLTDPRPVDWSTGGLFFAFAMLGALVTLYVTSPDNLPSIGGDQDVRELRDEFRLHRRAHSDALMARRKGSATTTQLPLAADSALLFEQEQLYLQFVGDLLAKSRRSLWRRVIPIFLALGPSTGVIFATTIWQALLIGSVGPATLSALTAGKEGREARAKGAEADEQLGAAVEDSTEMQRRLINAEQQLRIQEDLYRNSLRVIELMRTREGPPTS